MKRTGRSFISKIVEDIIKHSNKGEFSTAAAANSYMKKRATVEDDPLDINIKKYSKTAKMIKFNDLQLVTFGNKNNSKHTILYIHGGAYVNEIFPEHLRFCHKLEQKLNAYIVIPIYPLAPNNTYKDMYNMIIPLYKKLVLESKNNITMMGDSAGGGFAISFCQYLQRNKMTEPKNLIVMSPWVDVSMSGGPYEKYEQVDPMLGVAGLKEMGKVWAADKSPKDPLISPYVWK